MDGKNHKRGAPPSYHFGIMPYHGVIWTQMNTSRETVQSSGPQYFRRALRVFGTVEPQLLARARVKSVGAVRKRELCHGSNCHGGSDNSQIPANRIAKIIEHRSRPTSDVMLQSRNERRYKLPNFRFNVIIAGLLYPRTWVQRYAHLISCPS